MGPAPPTPAPSPPVVEVESAPASTLDEGDDADEDRSEVEAPPEEPEGTEDDALSEVENRKQEVADALASLTATTPGGLSGIGQGIGTLGGMGHGPFNGPRVSVVDSDTSVHGSLPKEAIRRVVRKHLNAYRRCYEQRLLQDPALEGKVVVKFVIAATGLVSQASIARALDAEVDRCVKNVTIRLRFPKPAGGGIVIVTYPFVFRTSAPTSPAPAPQP